MPRVVVDRTGAFYEEVTEEQKALWTSQPVQEVLVARQEAEMKIAAALGELYFKTGFTFTVKKSEMVKTDILDNQTKWDYIVSFIVHLGADL